MPARRRLDNRYKLPPRAKQLTGKTRRRQWRPVLYRGVVAYGSRRRVRRPYRHDVRRVGGGHIHGEYFIDTSYTITSLTFRYSQPVSDF